MEKSEFFNDVGLIAITTSENGRNSVKRSEERRLPGFVEPLME
jgi:hypothetical protein